MYNHRWWHCFVPTGLNVWHRGYSQLLLKKGLWRLRPAHGPTFQDFGTQDIRPLSFVQSTFYLCEVTLYITSLCCSNVLNSWEVYWPFYLLFLYVHPFKHLIWPVGHPGALLPLRFVGDTMIVITILSVVVMPFEMVNERLSGLTILTVSPRTSPALDLTTKTYQSHHT